MSDEAYEPASVSPCRLRPFVASTPEAAPGWICTLARLRKADGHVESGGAHTAMSRTTLGEAINPARAMSERSRSKPNSALTVAFATRDSRW